MLKTGVPTLGHDVTKVDFVIVMNSGSDGKDATEVQLLVYSALRSVGHRQRVLTNLFS